MVITLNESINSRRSIRKYLDKDVPRELIESIVDAGRLAPSAKNRQPWKYIVFTGDSKKELLDEMERGITREEKNPLLPDSKQGIPDAKHTLKIMREAPVTIIVINTNAASPFEKISADDRICEICDTLSVGASIENMLLRAQELGLGSLWIANTCYAYPELTEYLKTDRQLVGAIALGYANESPDRRPRKNISDILEYRT